jgi:hypothetical protein
MTDAPLRRHLQRNGRVCANRPLWQTAKWFSRGLQRTEVKATKVEFLGWPGQANKESCHAYHWSERPADTVAAGVTHTQLFCAYMDNWYGALTHWEHQQLDRWWTPTAAAAREVGRLPSYLHLQLTWSNCKSN